MNSKPLLKRDMERNKKIEKERRLTCLAKAPEPSPAEAQLGAPSIRGPASRSA